MSGKEHGLQALQYVTLPEPALSDLCPSCPVNYNIWQRSGPDKVFVSLFQNKKKIKRPEQVMLPTLTQIAAYSSHLHGKKKKSNYNRTLVNHIEKTRQAKTKTSKKTYCNTLYLCSIINIGAHTHIPEYMYVHRHTDTQTYT